MIPVSGVRKYTGIRTLLYICTNWSSGSSETTGQQCRNV